MNDMRQLTAQGRGIEEQSFSIIDAEIGAHDFTAEQWQVARRVIHATADFEFKQLLRFGNGAVEAGIRALRAGAPVIVDVKMIGAGLNEQRLAAYGSRVHCFISDADVIASATANDSTRAIEAMRKAERLGVLAGAVVAVGNAPTALLELLRLTGNGAAAPALVIGVPVGFVSAAESKDLLVASELPHIAAAGRKGGSAIAVAILHALLYLAAHAAVAEEAR